MKVIRPTRLVAEAADVLGEFRDSVVVVGAAAIEVALSGADVAITVLGAGGEATIAAGGEMMRLGQASSQRQAEARVRTAAAALQALDAGRR